MQILEHPISREELKAIAQNTFGDMVKCFADIRLGLLSIDADLHANLEALLEVRDSIKSIVAKQIIG